MYNKTVRAIIVFNIVLSFVIVFAVMVARTTHLDGTVNEKYPDVDVYRSSLLSPLHAVIIPPFGIFVSEDGNKNLIDHEYGHFLQYKAIGIWKFYRTIALPSIYNNYENRFEVVKYGYINYSVVHNFYLPETEANTLAAQFFHKPLTHFYPGYLSTRTPRFNWLSRLFIYIKT